MTLGVSELFGATFDIASPNWYATLSKNGELIQTRIRTSTRLEWSGGEERTDITTVPVRLDTSHRQFRDGSVEFDLSGQQIDIGVSAKTTLGVSAAVYQSISITATAISAALGGGWIWQIITFLRNRQKQPLRHIPLGKRLRDRDR